MSLAIQSVSLIRQNVTPTQQSTDLYALQMSGVRSISLVRVGLRAQNDEAPIWDAPTGGGSTVIIEDGPIWEDD